MPPEYKTHPLFFVSHTGYFAFSSSSNFLFSAIFLSLLWAYVSPFQGGVEVFKLFIPPLLPSLSSSSESLPTLSSPSTQPSSLSSFDLGWPISASHWVSVFTILRASQSSFASNGLVHFDKIWLQLGTYKMTREETSQNPATFRHMPLHQGTCRMSLRFLFSLCVIYGSSVSFNKVVGMFRLAYK